MEKIDRIQQKIIRATFFFREKYESLGLDSNIHTVYEIFVIVFLKELFKQLRWESQLQYTIPQNLALITKQTRCSLRGLFNPPLSKTTKNNKLSCEV